MMESFQNLKNTRTYLAGAMDRVADGGHGWRDIITPHLANNFGIKVLNPCKYPIKMVKEDEETRSYIENLKLSGNYDQIKTLYGEIRNSDLRCVDLSDFIICHIDIDIHMCGSYEEIVTANRQKKPILIWCKQGKQKIPNWLFFMLPHEHMFSSMEELLSYLQFIHVKNQINEKRWFFLREE